MNGADKDRVTAQAFTNPPAMAAAPLEIRFVTCGKQPLERVAVYFGANL